MEAVLKCAECGTTATPLWRKAPDGITMMCNACGIRLKRQQEASLKNTTTQRKKKTPGLEGPSSIIKKKTDLVLPSIHSLRLPPSTSSPHALPYISASPMYLPDPTFFALSKLNHTEAHRSPQSAAATRESDLFLNFVSNAAMRADTDVTKQPLNA